MTKAELVNKITSDTGIDKKVVSTVVEDLMVSIKEAMAEGKNIYLRGFGTFAIKTRAQKAARNITKNTTIIIPEHNIPAFKPAKEFMKSLL